MATLTTLAKLKIHLSITDTSEDTFLTQLLDAIEANVLGWLGRGALLSAAATEYFDGNGQKLLPLRRRPVTAVASVYVDGTGFYGLGTGSPFGASTQWVAGEQFAYRRVDESEENGGMLLAINGVWPRGDGNVKVTYTAGFTTTPDDVELAIWELCAGCRKSAEHGGPLKEEELGEYSYKLLTESTRGPIALQTAVGRLARYKEVSF